MKIALLLHLFLIFVPSSQAAAAPLVLSTFTGPPLSNKTRTGMYDHILIEAFKKIGKQIEILHLPAERSISNANSGITDGDFVRVPGLDKLYNNLIRVPEKITDFEFVAFSKNHDIKIAGWESLGPYNVAIVRGWKILEENIVGTSSLVRTKNQRLLFTLLEKDRADIVIYSRFEGFAVIKNLGFKQIKALEPPLAMREMFLYLNKKHAHIVPDLVLSLKKMKTDGTYEEIRNRTLTPYLLQ